MRVRSSLTDFTVRLRPPVALVLVIGFVWAAGLLVRSAETSQAAAVNVGYIDFRYGSTTSTTPTGEKPESKLWYNDGLWWGSLYDPNSQDFHIFRFNKSSQDWTDTGTALDDRSNTRADTLWDVSTQKLYVVSHIFTTNATADNSSANWGRLYRYSYNAASKSYSLDAGFPVTVTKGITETLTIARDSTGRLWVTYVQDTKVMVNHSVSSDTTWGTPYVLPVQNISVSSDDIAAVIAFQGNKIGVLWSNQLTSGMYMAVHSDGAADTSWQLETIAQGSGWADDHINVKMDGSGRLFVAAKTGMYGSNPLIVLFVRAVGGGWSSYTFGTGNDGHTRPIVMLDETNNRVYVFATSDDNSGEIYLKSSDMNQITFPTGMGTVFISDAASLKVNNPSSAKQNATAASGMLVIASNYVNRYYYHNDALAGGGTPTPTSTPTNTLTPTASPTPLISLTPSQTPTPSNTPTASNTPTPSNTPTATFTPTATPIPPETQTFGPSQDTQVKLSRPNNKYGTLNNLRLREALPAEKVNSYLKFDVSALAGPVTKATLRLYAYDGGDDGGSVYPVSNNYRDTSTPWIETGLTWNNAPLFSGSPLSSAGKIGSNAFVDFDVTAAITGSGTYSFALTNTSSNSVFFYSKESSLNPPQLIINTQSGAVATSTPVPTDTATATATASQTPTATATPLISLTPSITPTPSDTPTPSQTPTASSTPTNTPLPTATFTPTVTPVPPAVQTLAPSDDTQVKQAFPTSNYSTLDNLRVRLALPSDQINSYLKFTVPDTGGTITQATLRLYAYDGSDDGGSAYLVSNDYLNSSTPWVESDLNWNNAPLLSGSPLSSAGAVSSGSFVDFDVTAAITGSGTYSFALTNTSSNSALYYSKESAVNPPQLILNVQVSILALNTPIPSATNTATDTPALTETTAPSLMVVESNNGLVEQIGDWTAYTTDAASGGSYIYSSGGTGDALVLDFQGSEMQVVYVEHPALDTFAIEIDGITVGTIDSTNPDTVFGARASVTGLSEGEHVARVYPVSGTIAIDAFAIEALSAIPTPTPTVTATDSPAATATAAETASPTATPVPTSLPWSDSFESSANWTVNGAWLYAPQAGYQGNGWFADGRIGGQSMSLTSDLSVDLRTAQHPQLRFWQQAKLLPDDLIAVDIRLDDGTWLTLDQQTGGDWNWTQRTLDLTPYQNSIIRLRFRLETAASRPENVDVLGFWLDELAIEEAPIPTPTPLPTDIETPTPTLTETSLPSATPLPLPADTETSTPLPTETETPTLLPSETPITP